MKKNASEELPIEVALTEEVKSCRACPWFWEGTPPYGPYPAIDWDALFPAAMREKLPQTMNEKPLKWTNAMSVGEKLVEPAILRGCRKAPIMTIGINPNLTAYYAGQKAGLWCYPYFSETANYAYYYRHASIFQESLSSETIRAHIVPGTELTAEDDGWLIESERGTDHRWLHLKMKYLGREVPVDYEMTWTPELRVVVLADSTKETAIDPDRPPIKKGSLIAGKLHIPAGTRVEVYENGCGYYQRLLPVLAEFKKQLGAPGNTSELTMGEDVCMYDMVGCASPGWSSKYDIPRDRISTHCVQEKDFVLRQLLQSRPPVLVVVSTSSLAMFAQSFRDKGGSLTFPTDNRDVYDLLKETCCRRRYFEYTDGGSTYRARVIVTPHFSYPENFVAHSRFSLEAWEGFISEFPRDYETLKSEGRIGKQTSNNMIPIGIQGTDDPLREKLGLAAWEILLSRFYDPNALIVSALTDEYNQGNLAVNKKNGHLERSNGECTFCVNKKWQFPERCPYEKC